MKTKTKYIVTSITVILTLFITLNTMSPFDNRQQRKIYDDNSKIASVADSFSYNNRVGSNTENPEKNTNLKFELTGMETLWEINAQQEGTIEIDYTLNVSKGRCKVVLITPRDEVLDIVEGTETGSQTINLEQGKSRIKVVGDRATGGLNLKFSNYEGLELSTGNDR